MFHNALRKYGQDAFEWQVVCECRDKAHMDEMERFYIKMLNTMDRQYGYNLTEGGEGNPGHITTPETRAKLSKAGKGKSRNLGRKHTPEARANMSKAGKGRVLTQEHKDKIVKARKGIYHPEYTPEWKAKISASLVGNSHTKGHVLTQEHREKISKSYWDTKYPYICYG
jgi:group I intron endonuclease